MEDESIPFTFDFPSTDRIIEALLANSNMIAISGTIPEKLETENIADHYRNMPYDQLLSTSFQLTHFNIGEFDQPGDILHGFYEQVMEPWRTFLAENDFTWDRCYPIIRVSGPNSVTGYHMDVSNVLFWNVRGHKLFHGVQDPDRWAPLDTTLQPEINKKGRPNDLTTEDLLTIEVGDEQYIWNHLLTPHWVDAPELTVGINISHGGLRYKGQLGPREDAYYTYKEWDKHPDRIWRKQ
jgi:hypothetical protein